MIAKKVQPKIVMIDDEEHRSIEIEWDEAAYRIGLFLEDVGMNPVHAHGNAQQILHEIFEPGREQEYL